MVHGGLCARGGGGLLTRKRFVCIHGHFYQPPRENPWLEAIEGQDSAYPFHDWNERIAAECYTPNAASRVLDEEGWIRRIVNNYAHMSFNFGPTLLNWMEAHEPRTYIAVLEADALSRRWFGGHGSALAQPYNHMILPLADARDRRTQIGWGIEDFVRRFGREPEGMWLPETAADLATLDDLAAAGILFTVLAPQQARRFRPVDGGTWQDVTGGRIDPRRAYLQRLPSGREIMLFFYDGPVSQAVAFEQLLASGRQLADRLVGLFPQKDSEDPLGPPWLVHIATDGETYGHHHRHGDMALAYALNLLEAHPDIQITNYGEFLEHHPPRHEVEILERTSWSCAHGVERWRGDCGCTTEGRPGWNQAWRAPLRLALDGLRDRVRAAQDDGAGALFEDAWAAREAFIRVVVDRRDETLDAFLDEHARADLSAEERTRALKLMEMQRHLMLMYTSCGWFFDDLSRIETVQVLQYAGRAIQLAEDVLGQPFAEPFLATLREARSNLPDVGDGADVYRQHVQPAAVDLAWVAAHYALSSLFHEYADDDALYCYGVRRLAEDTRSAGRARLATGRVRVVSRVTREAATFSYAVVHVGDQSLHGGVRPFSGEEAERGALEDIRRVFDDMDTTNAVRLVDRHFAGLTYSLRSLFRDEQRRIVAQILKETVAGIEGNYEQVYDQHAPLIRFLSRLGPRLPRVLATTAEFVINARLRQALRAGGSETDVVRRLLEDAARDKIRLDDEGLGHVMARQVRRRMDALVESPDDIDRLRGIMEALRLLAVLPFEVDLRTVQNDYHRLLLVRYMEARRLADEGDPGARRWADAFERLGERLQVRVPA